MKKLFVCYSLYHVYVTLLKTMNMQVNYDVDIIITDQLPKYKNFYKKLKNSQVFREVMIVEDLKKGDLFFKNKNLIQKVLFVINYKNSLKKMFTEIELGKYDEVNIFFDRQHLSQYIILNHKNVILHEDSRFSPAAFKFKKNILRKLLEVSQLIPAIGGFEKNIREIECSDISMLPEKIKNKYRKTNNHLLEEKLTTSMLRTLISIFGEVEKPITKSSCLILTQPLYYDSLVNSEDKQIEIYKKVISKYCNDYENIYLKPHPRDYINYKEAIKNIKILEKDIPFELYKHLGITFEKYFTLFSTATRDLDESKVIKIGYEIDEELKINYSRYIVEKGVK